MIPVSDSYKELVKSNIRPKAEPIIKVSGKDNNGNDIELVWQAKNIKDLKYKRSVDPIGRELPYMELTWTEIYTGKLNTENYPEKYNNIAKYMAVELSFVQDLGFYNTWKTLFNGGVTWKELFKKTWKQVKNETTKEVITMPKLFLSAKPTISGQTITWVAKDVFSSLGEEEVVFLFDGKSYANIQPKQYINPIIYLLTNLRAAFLGSKELFNSVTKSINELKNTNLGNLDEIVIFKGNTKNSIMQYLNLRNLHINFKDDFFYIDGFLPKVCTSVFKKNIMYEYPEIINIGNISEYTFSYKYYDYETTDLYDVKPTIRNYINENAILYDYIFKDLGVLYSEDLGSAYLADVNRYSIVESPNYNQIEKVAPIKTKTMNSALKSFMTGEPYSEKNPMNIYNENSEELKSRFEFLKKYFNDNSSSLSFESLADLSVEAGDVISIETNLYDNERNITKNAMVVETELSYNGALKEKFKCHEVII